MITRNRYNLEGDTCYQGLSADEKPSQEVPINSLYLELDTNDFYYFDGSNWAKVGGTQLELFFDQTISTWDGQAGNNFYCTDYMNISKSPDNVVVEYDGTKYNCTKELDEEFGSYYYGAEYDAPNDTLDFSEYPFRAWFSDENETSISLMAPDNQTHTFKIYEVKSVGGASESSS